MKVYWDYMCEYAHRWVLFKDEEAEENREETLCPFGHEAITLKKCPPVDEVVITIQPAGRVVDRVKNQVYPEKKYWLLLRERVGGDEERKTKDVFSWREASKLAEKFHGLTKERAWQEWDKMSL